MQDLSVTLIQSALYWENPTANLAMFEEKIAQITTPTDLIVLPEMFSTGFTMNTQVAEPMNFTTFKWMKQQAKQTKAVVLGSVMIHENGKNFNRLIWMQPDGNYQYYDKRHLFRMGEEHLYFTEGNSRLITELKGWKICPLICYDLRFPVWARNVNQAYDVLIYVANWPAARSHPWNTLLLARAIENQSYTIGVNRVGTDGKDYAFSGDSAAINYKGEYLYYQKDQEEVHTVVLSKQDLVNFRTQFPAYLDADSFVIQ